MNNYSNMNYYMPGNMINIPNDYMNEFYQNQINQNKVNQNQKVLNNINQDNQLKMKLAKQAGDNMNFNKCNYIQSVSPDNLYDVYGGFIRGNMFSDLYNSYKISKPFEIEPLNEQAELLTYLDAYSFGAHDLNLYLDTHPNDKSMIELFNSYIIETKKIQDEYERRYGPLFVEASKTYPWAWNETPWPWEN